MINYQQLTNQYFNTYEFQLPIGIIDDEGRTHDRGLMRTTTGMDELCWQQDIRTLNNPTYGILILLSRTILNIGDITRIKIDTIENLLLNDFKYLVNFYNQINPDFTQIDLLGKKLAIL